MDQQGAFQRVLKLSDLARRPDFQLGPLSISPSRRRVEGHAGTAHLEPLVMRVFLMLIDARGELVTRDQLFAQVWGGAMVGDDSLNRAIAAVRRVAVETAPGLFEIETIPRTGYRLLGEIAGYSQDARAESQAPPRLSRRILVGGGAAAAAVLGAGGLWWADSQQDREFDELMARAQEAMDHADPAAKSGQYLERAVAIRPNNARAQGLFAYSRALRADNAERGPGDDLKDAEQAISAALAIDPNEPNARLAEIVLQGSMLDFAATEDRLRNVLAQAPDNLSVMRQLWAFLVCVGRIRDGLAMVERALALKPLIAGNNYPWAQFLWILGRTAEADRVIDRALQYWPSHRYVRWARFSIFAFTGRPRAALTMIENEETRPQNFTPPMISLWRVSLRALDERTPESIATARRANIGAAKQDLRLSLQAVQSLSALGEIDAAFEVANAFFAVGRSAEQRRPANRIRARSNAWRFAPWLFTPPTAAMRADPRFTAICDEIGLTEYWAKRGIRPDYQLGIT